LITEKKRELLFTMRLFNEVISEVKNSKVEKKLQVHINAFLLL